MKYFVVKFSRDWADEFDVYGMQIINETKFDAINKALENKEVASTEFKYSFGTNEGWEGDCDLSELWEEFVFTEIDASQAETIYNVFGATWGNFPDIIDQFESITDNPAIEEFYALAETGAFRLNLGV